MQELSGETGITLAYAGKSRVAALRLTLHRDHPRVCGEKPPPKRPEKPHQHITPAYAGKSQPWRSYSQRRWDHPRVCGEKFLHTFAVIAG